MKKVFILRHVNILSTCLMLGLLFIAANLYAAGDLIVEGNVGIGTTSPNTNLDVAVDGIIPSLYGSNSASGNLTLGSTKNATKGKILFGNSAYDEVNNRLGIGTAFPHATLDIKGDAIVAGRGLFNLIIDGQPGTTYWGNTALEGFLDINLSGMFWGAAGISGTVRIIENDATGIVNNAYGIKSVVSLYSDWIGGTVNNVYGIHSSIDYSGGLFAIDNLYGIYVQKATGGTNNYGIVLAGDGAGADIVFGPNQEAKIYSNAGELFAKDGTGNVTQISPHDPETGEWIFYSKNVKTGKVVRVDMERLVKAVEKLTGEKFMVEARGEVEQ